MGNGNSASRFNIALSMGTIVHNGMPCRIVMKRSLISVGCTDITPEAAKRILDEYNKRFGQENEIVVQNGGFDPNTGYPVW